MGKSNTLPKPKITFDEDSKPFILKALKHGIDQEGYIINEEGKRAHGLDGKEITTDDFCGVMRVKGETVFFRQEDTTLVGFLELRKQIP